MRRLTDGEATVEVDASTVRRLLAALDQRFPGLRDELIGAARIAINGEVVGESMRDAMLEDIPTDAEVVFIHAVSGG